MTIITVKMTSTLVSYCILRDKIEKTRMSFLVLLGWLVPIFLLLMK